MRRLQPGCRLRPGPRARPHPRPRRTRADLPRERLNSPAATAVENEYTSKKHVKAEKNDVVAKIHEEKRARLDEEIEETQAKAEEDKLKGGGRQKSGSKPVESQQLMKKLQPQLTMLQAAAEAKEAAAAACDDARKEEKGQGGAEAESGLQRQRPQHRPKSKEKGDFRSPEKGVASVAAAKKSAEDTHVQMLVHEKP